MRIEWADFADDAPKPIERTPLKPGFHWGVVERVNSQPAFRVTDRNPSGDCLSIWIDCDEGGETKRVFHTVATNWTRKLIEIARCAGVEPPQKGRDEWDEQTLVGARLYVETATYIVQQGKNAGQERATVVQFVPPDRQPKETETAQERRARHDSNEVHRGPRRTTAQKCGEVAGADDIPF